MHWHLEVKRAHPEATTQFVTSQGKDYFPTVAHAMARASVAHSFNPDIWFKPIKCDKPCENQDSKAFLSAIKRGLR